MCRWLFCLPVIWQRSWFFRLILIECWISGLICLCDMILFPGIAVWRLFIYMQQIIIFQTVFLIILFFQECWSYLKQMIYDRMPFLTPVVPYDLLHRVWRNDQNVIGLTSLNSGIRIVSMMYLLLKLFLIVILFAGTVVQLDFSTLLCIEALA